MGAAPVPAVTARARLRHTLVLLLWLTVPHTGCVWPDDLDEQARLITGGEPTNGRVLVERHGCGSCHEIPGVRGARGLVGPPLEGVRERMYLAGVQVNGVEELVRWIVDPQAVDSMTAMPAVGLTEAEARDVAAFLYSLR